MEGEIPENNETQHQHCVRKQRSLKKFRRKCDVCGRNRYWPLSMYKCKDCSFKCHKKCWENMNQDLKTFDLYQGDEQDVITECQDVIPTNYESREPRFTAQSEMVVSRYPRDDSAALYRSPHDITPAPTERPYRLESPTSRVSSYDLSPAPSHVSRHGSLSVPYTRSLGLGVRSSTDRPSSAVPQQLTTRPTAADVVMVQFTRSYTYAVMLTTTLTLDTSQGYRSNVLTSLYMTNRTTVTLNRGTRAAESAAGALTSGENCRRMIDERDGFEKSAANRFAPAIVEGGSKLAEEKKKPSKDADVTSTTPKVRLTAYGRSKSDVNSAGKKWKRQKNRRAMSAA